MIEDMTTFLMVNDSVPQTPAHTFIMNHTKQPDDTLYIATVPGETIGIERSAMTNFLTTHIDLLERPGKVHHTSMVEGALPRVRFSLLEDDEWIEEQAKLCDFFAVNITPESSFVVDHEGSRKKFTASYTVFHETAAGSRDPGIGSTCLPLLLTNTYVQPGLFTYAHIKLAEPPVAINDTPP